MQIGGGIFMQGKARGNINFIYAHMYRVQLRVGQGVGGGSAKNVLKKRGESGEFEH